METYITICKIDNQWDFALWLRKLKQGLCINLEGWGGEGGGREVQKGGVNVYFWLIHTFHSHMKKKYSYVYFLLRFDRKQQNSAKQLSLN